MGNEESGKRERPLCLNCEHFYITHQPDFPYGCKAMGFKSAKPPYLEVLRTSGIQCLAYKKKPKY